MRGGARDAPTAAVKLTIVIVLAVALVGGVVGIALGLGLGGKARSPTDADVGAASELSGSTQRGLSPEELYARDAPAVVAIESLELRKGRPLGSGFALDKHGDLVTTDEAVRRRRFVRVDFTGGASYVGRVLGADASTDVAVVRVAAPRAQLDPLRFASSKRVAVGDPAFAIGDASGGDRRMRSGIVSARGAEVRVRGGGTIVDSVETDVTLARDDAGGPLLDRYGHVVGVDAGSPRGSVDADAGVSVAVAADIARRVAGELIRSGRAGHPWLGVEAATVDTGVARSGPSHGVAVARVIRGGPAAKAGIVAAERDAVVDGVRVFAGGDVIVAVDGTAVATSQQLLAAVAERRPGERVSLEVVRNGRRHTVAVRLGNAPRAGR